MSGPEETHDHDWQPVLVPFCLLLLVILTVGMIGGNWLMCVERSAGTIPALRASEGDHTYQMATYPPTNLLWHDYGFNPNAGLLPPKHHTAAVQPVTPETAAPATTAAPASPAESATPAQSASPAASASSETSASPSAAASSSP
ncbi:MAG: hypothetical protein ACYCW6_25310 [Candidatus Xenobia bacterium]